MVSWCAVHRKRSSSLVYLRGFHAEPPPAGGFGALNPVPPKEAKPLEPPPTAPNALPPAAPAPPNPPPKPGEAAWPNTLEGIEGWPNAETPGVEGWPNADC